VTGKKWTHEKTPSKEREAGGRKELFGNPEGRTAGNRGAGTSALNGGVKRNLHKTFQREGYSGGESYDELSITWDLILMFKS